MNLTEAVQHIERLCNQQIAAEALKGVLERARDAISQAEEAEKRRDRLRVEVTDLDAEAKKLTTQLATKRREWTTAHKQHERDSQARSRELRVEIDNVQHELAQKREAANTEFRTHKAELERQLAGIRKAIDVAKRQEAQARAALKELKAQVAGLQ